MLQALDRLEEFAIDVILERRYGKRAAILRGFLRMLSMAYNRIIRVRLWLYEERYAGVHALGCLVISVGNLTVGGTGKTPIVEKLAKALTKQGRKVAILSRGYKSQPRPLAERWGRWLKPGSPRVPPRIVSDGSALLLDSEKSGDEPFMLAHNLKDVVVLVDKNRVHSGLFALEKFGVDTLLLDDGYQYMALKERVDIVLVDRESPFGNRFMLPRGTLREPPDHLRRANYLFITKCDGSDLTPLREELRKFNRHARIIECAHHPQYLEDLYTQERLPLTHLKGLRIGSVSGIARPESFEDGLRKLEADIVYTRRFADHHRFSMEELQHAVARSKARGARAVITTEKDAVRFAKFAKRELPIYFLRVEIRITSVDDSFEQVVAEICNRFAPSEKVEKSRG